MDILGNLDFHVGRAISVSKEEDVYFDEGGVILIACSDPLDDDYVSALEKYLGKTVAHRSVAEFLRKFYNLKFKS